ncbi:putative cyclic nucleotide-gated ion channel 18-like protein [Corchorus olitorius]|uniref:Cyclic nucleotide-gated ion channel 18-like protein n=1 Tax=Corchorus olitorius TaxID=93759 RepID=A0A1R3KFL2_9ROSI|nr:putative cyclic nucleotide-gated ion channel 18-like protein [Corchorus olitorius]
MIPLTKNTKVDHANNPVALIVLLQYVPTLFLIFPLNRKIIKSTGIIAMIAWAGAAYNLLLYLLASHVLGAIWYFCSKARQFSYWNAECVRGNCNRIVYGIQDFLDGVC